MSEHLRNLYEESLEHDNGDHLFDWKCEAEQVIQDIKNHVQEIIITDDESLITDKFKEIYLNITILENKRYCIRMSAEGFQIVGNEYNQKMLNNEIVYETPYALLNIISKKYIQSFGNDLTEELLKLT